MTGRHGSYSDGWTALLPMAPPRAARALSCGFLLRSSREPSVMGEERNQRATGPRPNAGGPARAGHHTCGRAHRNPSMGRTVSEERPFGTNVAGRRRMTDFMTTLRIVTVGACVFGAAACNKNDQ